jgi:hypothetical protein
MFFLALDFSGLETWKVRELGESVYVAGGKPPNASLKKKLVNIHKQFIPLLQR